MKRQRQQPRRQQSSINGGNNNNMKKRFLNVEYSGTKTTINVTDFVRLCQVQVAVKQKYDNSLAGIGAAFIQFYDQENQQITDLDDIDDVFFKKLKNGGRFLVIRTSPPPSRESSTNELVIHTSPPPSRQPTQSDLGSTLPAAPQEVSDFWIAFSNYSGTYEPNDVVQLPADVSILGHAKIGSSIYIRPCYPKLYKISMSIVESANSRDLVILGTPGIGKTFFGYYLLMRLARSGKTVVYESRAEDFLYLFTPDGVKKDTRPALRHYLRLSTTYYIVDAKEPEASAGAKTILISSLRKDVWHHFSKRRCALRYMPVWSEEEIFQCRKLLYPNISQDLVLERYSKWGGNARYVLEFANASDQQALLTKALDTSNFGTILGRLFGPGVESDIAGTLIHISADDRFYSGPYQFASDYVVDEMYYRALARDPTHLIHFLSATEEIGETGQLRDALFKKHAHTVFARGGVFKIRNLHTNKVFKLELPVNQSTFAYSSNDSEFQAAENGYIRLASNTFASVDAFIKPNLLFQLTGIQNHPCKQTDLCDVLEILDHPSNPALFFVVSPYLFRSFTLKSCHGPDGHVVPDMCTVASVKEISQFVLTFDLPSE